MNKEYINKLYEDNKEIFNESENEINSSEELEEQILAYITSNMEYDYNVSVDTDKLFEQEPKSELKMLDDLEVELQYDKEEGTLYIGTPSSSGCEYSCSTAEQVAEYTKEYILDTVYFLTKEKHSEIKNQLENIEEEIEK